MGLIDLKYTAAEKSEEVSEGEVGPDGQPAEYPWGLCIRLEDEEITKLGLAGKLQAGGAIHFNATAHICSTTQKSEPGEEPEEYASLQIEMMEVTLIESAAEEASEVETSAVEDRENRTRTVTRTIMG